MSNWTAEDWTMVLCFVFSTGCALVGIVSGIAARRRERRWFEENCTSLASHDRGVMTVADLEEMRWRKAQRERGGNDAA